MKTSINHWTYVVLLCLTIGLAPFVPEPHLWGKIRWIAGGAKGMAALDWFDFLFHATPWLLLIRLVFMKLRALWIKPATKAEPN